MSEREDVQFLQGDCRAVLATLPPESVHCCITSPPYWGLRCYGVDGQLGLEPTPEEHVEKMVEVFAEVKRVLRKDGVCFVNYGDCYASAPNGRPADQVEGDDRTFRDKPFSTVSKKREKREFEYNTGFSTWTTRDVTPSGRSAACFKPKDLCGMPWRVAFALQADGWWLRSAMPWVKRCLSGGTVVYARTQKGEMPTTIKDLVRLRRPETVQLWNGERWTQVVGWCETPRPATTYEIELRSGERVGCTGDHRWPTQRGNVYARDLKVGDVVQTCRLPEPPEPARPMALDDAMVGWFVGLYIAEGCKDDRCIHIAGHVKEEERLAKLQAIATAYHGHCAFQRSTGNSCNINLHGPMLHGILETYVSGEGAAHKHLNVRCWERSDTFLMALLEGYLSGDGHWDDLNQRWRLGFTSNDALAQDLRTICGRLGVVLRLRRFTHTMNGRKFPGYRGEIRFDVNRRQPRGGFVRKEQGEVVAIRPSRARKFWDIEVEDEPHLFALASGLLTHNSAMPESCTDRPSTALEYVFILTKSPKYYWDADAVRRPQTEQWISRTSGKAVPRPQAREEVFGKAEHTSKVYAHSENGRNLRNADFYWDSLDLAIEQARAELAHLEHVREKGGLLLSEEGEPLALDVNTEATKEAHFATFPRKLVEPLIKAGTSERGCCAECGAPWVRDVKKDFIPQEDVRASLGVRGHAGQKPMDQSNGWQGVPRGSVKSQTLGWQPSCKCACDTTVPATVLDPFAGSGTVGLAATKLGRKAILIDLKSDYIDLQKKRNAQVSMLL